MTTHIESNGSKWLGQAPDPISVLIEVLGKHPLDRSFEAYGNFIREPDTAHDATGFFGNFLTLSHVFNIRTDDTAVIDALTHAIRANQQRPDYLRQQTPEERKRAADEEYAGRCAKITADRQSAARLVLGMEA